MSKEFKNFIKKKESNFISIKNNKKKHIYKIKDGYFTFDINLENPSCILCNSSKGCSLKKCYHLYKLLNLHYNISFDNLQFLWINDNYIKALNNQKLEIQSIDLECPICLEIAWSEKYNPNKTIHCLDCGKFYHIDCLNKTKKGIVCLNCNNDWLPQWMK
jgi:hypothetical protein|tara:strand:- start:1093 stop:1572 length:480 start_codon:yes stop_codon:yes gene_type:complete